MNILLIEDDTSLARVLEISLQREGHTVAVTHDGKSGYESAHIGDYDVIVIDWMLPSMTGVEVCRRLRDSCIDTPIIMLTGKSADTDKVHGLDNGADDYLTKPFNSNELNARLRAVTRRRQSRAKATILQLADLTMNVSSRVVTRAGVDLHLMPKEFELLEYFLRHPNVALSRETILQDVWGITTSHSSNRLDVHIRNLRQKIDQGFETALLHTVRGVGYRLSA